MTERSPGEELTAQQETNGHANGLPKEFFEEWRDVAYNCFSSGHKFCREVCPVMQVTRDERHSPTAFHADVVAMEKGHLSVEGRGRGLRPLHDVRGVRAALPQHVDDR